MGLLSDPEYGSVKWVRVLKRIHGPLCFLCYVGALVWFVMLGNREFNNETYFSENALLPGLVTNEFNGEQAAKQFYSELQQELYDKYDDSDAIPVPWLVAKMSQMHLEVYTHNFTLNYPMGQGQVYKGTNVYGILRAPRTSSLEALVVTAPFRSVHSHQKGTAAGIALMLAFAQFARPQKYWAKDIIFLVTEHEQLGMQAWLEAYHGLHSDVGTFYTSLGSFWKPGTPAMDLSKMLPAFARGDHQKCLNPGKLGGRSGSIQAAINLEFHTPKIKYIEVKVEGLNGQLPNLDLVNLVHKLCVKSGIHHSYKNSYSWIRTRNKMEEWTNGVWTMMGMVTAQIAGVPNGNHGLFHRFGIEAVTLEGREAGDPAGAPARVSSLSPANFHRLGVALESILRSLNNLLESFHQSYFFYMLAATNRFISIGQYMPCLCLLCVAMLIRALSLWVTIQQDNEDEADKKTDKKRKTFDVDLPGEQETEGTPQKEIDEKEELPKKKNKAEKVLGLNESVEGLKKEINEQKVRKRKSKAETVLGHEESEKVETSQKEKEDDKVGKEESSMSVVNIGANYLLVHLVGYAVMNSPKFLCYIGISYYEHSEMAVYYGLIHVSIFVTVLAPLLTRVVFRPRRRELQLVTILLLVELATACLAVGMHNFPLGLAIAVLYTPLALVVSVVDSRKRNSVVNVKRVACLLVQPLCAVSLAMMLYSARLFPEEGAWGAFTRGADAAMQALMFSIVDSMIYGNWLFNVVTCVLFPIWILFWQILCTEVEAPESIQ